MQYEVTKEHQNNFPVIRISEIELYNFKNTRYGKIVLNCGKKFIPYGTESDILGIYGQNGSGKTSIIEAISILKYILSGKAIPPEYADCINADSEYAELSFSFDFQYPDKNEYPTNKDVRKVIYSFKIKRVIKPKHEKESYQIFADKEIDEFFFHDDKKKSIVVFDEIFKVSGTICGERVVLKPFLSTANNKAIIEPKAKVDQLLGKLDEAKRLRLGINKARAIDHSMSFIFLTDVMEMFSEYGNYSPYYQMLIELNNYGINYLHVIDSKPAALVGLNLLPIFHDDTMMPLPINKSFVLDNDTINALHSIFGNINVVLQQIVPGLTVFINDLGSRTTSDGEAGQQIELLSRRDNTVIPLSDESEGVKKIVATLQYLILAYNHNSVTVAFDEFDSGIFEYLLGEILQVMQDSGKGQFIFTSHNMRPLEVLHKESICFTTANPDNRYMKMTGIGETNNLRKVYYREIAMHDHYSNLYTETKKNLIISALRKAGGN